MKIRSALYGLTVLAIAGCSNPFPFGPGRVEIKLEEAAVRAVPHEVLFPGSGGKTRAPRDVLVMAVSSQTELLSYFKEQDRQLQVRCAVEGNEGTRTYEGFALGPVPETTSGSGVEKSRGRYLYTIYSFVDLKADDEAYEGGKPATQLDLREASFSFLQCHLLGVTKAPVLLPRSNDVSVTADTFRGLLRKADTR